MGARGPKPLPANVHRLRGNPSKLAFSGLADSVDPAIEVPGVPRHLWPEARCARAQTPRDQGLGEVAGAQGLGHRDRDRAVDGDHATEADVLLSQTASHPGPDCSCPDCARAAERLIIDAFMTRLRFDAGVLCSFCGDDHADSACPHQTKH